MERATATPKADQPGVFYSKTVGDQTFNFRRPGLDLIDGFLMGTSRKGPTRAAAKFTKQLVTEGSQSAWQERTENEPGLMTEVAQEILERLGFN